MQQEVWTLKQANGHIDNIISQTKGFTLVHLVSFIH